MAHLAGWAAPPPEETRRPRRSWTKVIEAAPGVGQRAAFGVEETQAGFGLDATDPGFWQKGLGVIEGLITELEGMERG